MKRGLTHISETTIWSAFDASVRFRHILLQLQVLVADFAPDSLKHSNAGVLICADANGFGSIGISRVEFECCMASYFSEITDPTALAPDGKFASLISSLESL